LANLFASALAGTVEDVAAVLGVRGRRVCLVFSLDVERTVKVSCLGAGYRTGVRGGRSGGSGGVGCGRGSGVGSGGGSGVGSGRGSGGGSGDNTAAVAELCHYDFVHVALAIHVVGVASTPASVVVVVHVPRQFVVVRLTGGVTTPKAESVSRLKANLVVGGETERPVSDAVPVGTVDAVCTAKGTVTRVSAVVASGEDTARWGESANVVVVATIIYVLSGDEHPIVVGVPVTDDVAHVTAVLGTVLLIKTHTPTGKVFLRDVVVNANLGFFGGVGDVLGFTSAQRFVVPLVAIVERAVGVGADVGGDTGVITRGTVSDVVHVGRFSDLGGHLFGSHEGT